MQPGVGRKALHAETSELFPKGLPASHTVWRNAEMDEWVARCKAIAQPANFTAQRKQVAMPDTRRRVFVRHLLTALEAGDEYADGIIDQMQGRRRNATTGGRSVATIETLGEAELERLTIALKLACKRRWPKKEDLLEEVFFFAEQPDFSEAAACAAILKALNVEHLARGISFLQYEDLLVALSALRTLPAGAPAEVEIEEPEAAEIDIPF